uniref:Uncharacterized protein n=1 Tax=viral metagenome TaxID=1070528 RepID=A0A6C0JRM7_9ZZZZ
MPCVSSSHVNINPVPVCTVGCCDQAAPFSSDKVCCDVDNSANTAWSSFTVQTATVTDSSVFSPLVAAVGGVIQKGFYRVSDKTLYATYQVRGSFVSGVSGYYAFNLPPGLALDTNFTGTLSTPDYNTLGYGFFNGIQGTTYSNYNVNPIAFTSTYVGLFVGYDVNHIIDTTLCPISDEITLLSFNIIAPLA